MFCVGDEVDIHLGELWHRTIRYMDVKEAHGSSTNPRVRNEHSAYPGRARTP